MIAQSPFALMYRCFAKDFKVYAFSRRNNMPEGFTTADMADVLDKITCPSLDGVLGVEASLELKEKINGSRIYIYQGYSTERHIGEEVITDIASFINAEEENTDGIEEN